MAGSSPRSELEAVFLANRVSLERAARRIVHSQETTEDVVQDAFVKLLHLPDLDKVQQPLAYCRQVVRNVAIDHCRRQSMETAYRVSTDVADIVEPQTVTAATPERLLDGRQALESVANVLDSLPTRTRQAFELWRLSGFTQREIAERLGCSATLVNFILKEADAALRSYKALLE